MNNAPVRATLHEDRWGAAATILSLDVVAPFFEHMGVPTHDPDGFQRLLRECILVNRGDFEQNPARVPDLRGRWLDAAATSFGKRTAEALDFWVARVFMHTAEDFADLSDWYYVLVLARMNPSHWQELQLPSNLSQEALHRLNDVLDRTELHKLADDADAKLLSDWDLEMYSLHGFDEDENPPYNWVLETVKRRRFTNYLQWLARILSDNDREAFVRSANAVRDKMETTHDFTELSDFMEHVSSYADPSA